MKKYLVALIIVTLSACSTDNGQKAQPPADSAAAETSTQQNSDSGATAVQDDEVQNQTASKAITFKKTSCPNEQCKPYVIQVVAENLSAKVGQGKSATNKNVFLKLSQVDELTKLIDGLKLVSMKTQVVPGSKLCGQYHSDEPTYILALQKGSFPQTLEVYAGCKVKPEYQNLINWFAQFVESKPQSAEF